MNKLAFPPLQELTHKLTSWTPASPTKREVALVSLTALASFALFSLLYRQESAEDSALLAQARQQFQAAEQAKKQAEALLTKGQAARAAESEIFEGKCAQWLAKLDKDTQVLRETKLLLQQAQANQDQAKQRLKTLQQELNATKDELAQAREQAKKDAADLHRIRGQRAKLRERVKSLQASQARAEKLKPECEQLRSQVKQAQAALAKAERKHRQQREKMQAEQAQILERSEEDKLWVRVAKKLLNGTDVGQLDRAQKGLLEGLNSYLISQTGRIIQ